MATIYQGATFYAPISAPLALAPDEVTSQSLIAWYRADLSTRIHTTLRPSGTTPPAVTVSGTLTQALGIHIDIETGATTFRWSQDNGTTWDEEGVTIPLGGTHVLGATGITALFPNATYNADNLYESVCDLFTDQGSNGYDFSNAGATTTKPRILTTGGAGGLAQPCLRFNTGDSTRLESATGFANALAGGVDKPFHLFMVINPYALPTAAGVILFSVGRSSSTSPRINYTIAPNTLTPANPHRISKSDDVATSEFVDSVVGASTGPTIIEFRHTGTAVGIYENGELISSTDVEPSDVGTLTLDQAAFGCLFIGTSRSNFANFDLYESFAFEGILSASDIDGVYRYLGLL